jgi:hypothetical protein
MTADHRSWPNVPHAFAGHQAIEVTRALREVPTVISDTVGRRFKSLSSTFTTVNKHPK